MKKTLLWAVMILIGASLGAQAPLPTSFSFDNGVALPTGWVENILLGTGTNTRYTPGSDATSACRLDFTGEFVSINFLDAPGSVSYFIKGTGIPPAAAFQGQFDVQESVDGNVWTSVRTFTNTDLTGTYTQFTHNLLSTSRVVRFFYTTKVSGSNIGLDQISIQGAVNTVEIAVSQNGTPVSNNGTIYVGNSAAAAVSTTLTINNTGTTTALNLGTPVISGANASDFSVVSFPTQVAFGASSVFSVVFTPSGATGNKAAILTFVTNDADENPTVINLTAVNGTMSSEPNAATAFASSNVKTWTMNVSWAAPTTGGADGYLVLRKPTAAITEAPTDGLTYLRGDYIGGAQVVYSGAGTSVTPRWFQAGTDYNYAVFSYNGNGTVRNYASTPLNATVRTPNDLIGTYYQNINPNASTFVADLTALINPHTQIFYQNYASSIMTEYYMRDTTGGMQTSTCVYSGFDTVYAAPFTFSLTGFNREHTYAWSWMQALNPVNGITVDSVPYSDLHNLFPTRNDVNAARLNNPFGVPTTVQGSFGQARWGTSGSQNVFEMRDIQKGDAARTLMYQVICYNGWGRVFWRIPFSQSQALLKAWNTQDPPSKQEMARNDYVHFRQRNRNPFVDHPEWVDLIDFNVPSYISGIDEQSIGLLIMFPNPATESTTIQLPNMEGATMKVYDMAGRLVHTQTIMETITQLSTSAFNNGMYIVRVENEKAIYQAKLNVQR